MAKRPSSSRNEYEFAEQTIVCRATDQYEVGYGKPPQKNRFKKGMSGNPKGRPKKTSSPKQSFHEVFTRKILATVDGKKQYINGTEALFLQLRAKTSKGDLQAVRIYFTFCKLFGTDDPSAVNIQLQGLFDALMAGPVDDDTP
jgi:Family of unknown function (DUF5681)